MSVEYVHVYLPSQVLTQDLNVQQVAYLDSNGTTDSLEVPESVGARSENSPSQEKLCQCVFNKLKEWFNRFLSYLS